MIPFELTSKHISFPLRRMTFKCERGVCCSVGTTIIKSYPQYSTLVNALANYSFIHTQHTYSYHFCETLTTSLRAICHVQVILGGHCDYWRHRNQFFNFLYYWRHHNQFCVKFSSLSVQGGLEMLEWMGFINNLKKVSLHE